MPIYEYRCRGCNADFEKYVPGAATKVACPTCASGDIMRKLSVFGLRSDGVPSPRCPAVAVAAAAAAGAGVTDYDSPALIGAHLEGPARAFRV